MLSPVMECSDLGICSRKDCAPQRTTQGGTKKEPAGIAFGAMLAGPQYGEVLLVCREEHPELEVHVVRALGEVHCLGCG